MNIETKRVWFWPARVYITPYALSWEYWDVFEKEIKEKYPVQHFFRKRLLNKFYLMQGKISFFFWKFKYFFRNPRKEMRAAVFPARWEDLDSVLENFSREMIKEFVEREEAMLHLERNDSFKKQLNKYYNYVVDGRLKFIAQMGVASRSKTKKYISMARKLDKMDEELLCWVVKNRGRFWT